MKTKIIVTTLLLSMTNVTHAGFFDSFLGGGEEEVKATSTKAVTEKATAETSTVSSAASMAKGLIPTLTDQLGVTNAQAEGGLGSIMELAKGSLSTDEFSQLSGGVPDMSSLLAAVPALTGGGSGGLTDMLSDAGGIGSSLAGISKLTQQFEALGLSPEMISQFADIAMDYFSGDSSTSDLLQKGLSSLLK